MKKIIKLTLKIGCAIVLLITLIIALYFFFIYHNLYRPINEWDSTKQPWVECDFALPNNSDKIVLLSKLMQ